MGRVIARASYTATQRRLSPARAANLARYTAANAATHRYSR